MSEEWDSSVRTERLGVFCRQHGFYDCPVCRGESPMWEIPIVENGKEVGMLRIPWDFDDTLILVSGSSSQIGLVDEDGHKELVQVPHPQAKMIPITVNPGLLAKIRLLLADYDD